jgi:molybdopterin-binding protein
VKLELADTRTLVAVTSCDGLKALGLREGDSVFALINASHVLIAVND